MTFSVDLKGLFDLTEAQEVGDPPVPVFGDRAWFGYNECRIWLRSHEEWEWGTLNLELDCDPPPYTCALYHELDAVGPIEDVLGLDDVERFLMENGLAPGQPFYIYASFWYSGPDRNGEYDSDSDFKILDQERWTADQAATAWEAFYARQHMLIFG